MAQYAAAQDDRAQGNVDIVLTAMRELFADKDLTAIDRYRAEPCIQHSPQMPNGLDTLRQVVPTLEGFSWKPQRIAARGDLVFTRSIVHGWAPDPVAIVGIFRLGDGRIVEHWDVVQDVVPPEESANGNAMV